jgi:hypothetical protein
MNKIITCFFAIVIFAAFSVAAGPEETSQLEESSHLRQVRAPEAETQRRRAGKKKGGNKKGRGKRRPKSLNRKGKGKGRPMRKGKGKGRPMRNGKGKGRPMRKGRKQESRQESSSPGASCLGKAVKYMKQWKDLVTNHRKQAIRAKNHAKIGSKKTNNSDMFAPTAHRLVEAGGNNRSNLSCGGEYGNQGAMVLTNLTENIFACEATLKTACKLPEMNATLVEACTELLDNFGNHTEKCMKLSIGKATEAEYNASCTCWENATVANMSNALSACVIKEGQQNITKQKKKCIKEFSACKGYLQDANQAIASCTTTADKLTAKAQTLSANKDAVMAAKEKMSSLANSTRKHFFRQTAASCAEVITKSQSLTVMISQSPSGSSISVLALEISSVSSSVQCSDTEKASLTTEISSVESAIATISQALEAVQAQILTLTGSTVSTSVSTSAPSVRRDRILQNILRKSF